MEVKTWLLAMHTNAVLDGLEQGDDDDGWPCECAWCAADGLAGRHVGVWCLAGEGRWLVWAADVWPCAEGVDHDV